MSRIKFIGISIFALLGLGVVGAFVWIKFFDSGKEGLETPRTTVESQEVKLVEGFPTVFVYPKANVVHSEKGERDSFSAELNSSGSVPTVASWYADTLTDQGWVIVTPSSDSNNKDVQTIRATKGEQSFIVSVIRNPDNKTKIVLGQWQKIPDEEDEEYQEK